MKIYKEDIRHYLDANEKYTECLFRRGYIITQMQLQSLDKYPYYGNWSSQSVGAYNIYIHKDQTAFFYTDNGVTVAIIGHAYNPFNMKYNENEILKDIYNAYKQDSLFDAVSELTGIHLICVFDGEKLIAVQDCCGMCSCYFGKINDSVVIADYPQMIGDIFGLKHDSFVTKLVSTKCYNIGNRHLPGNISPYKELKRMGGNTYLLCEEGHFSIKRFYPTKAHEEFESREEFENGVKKIYDIIHNGIDCCSKKWERRTISLSGGTDSKTTLACASGLYDKYTYYSFYSKPSELVDAKAAKQICEKIGLKHDIYKIPETNQEIEDFDFWKKLMYHNRNYISFLSDAEIRKYVYLYKLDAYDIELKSWASEVARVFFERKYQINMPKQLTERHCSIFQTRFFMHPLLLRKSDKIYREFLEEIDLKETKYNYEHTDLFYWEVRMGAWGTSVTSSQNVFHRITMPINNRKLLEIFLSFPHDYRKSDNVHKDVIQYGNRKINDSNIEVKNLYFHSYRIWMEKLYYYYRTIFYKNK